MAENLSLRFKSSDFKNYQKEILVNSKSKFFLPLSYVEDNENIIVNYFGDNYSKVLSGKTLKTMDLLSLLRKVFLAVNGAKNDLFFLEDYVLSRETIYINDYTGDIKFIFVPQNHQMDWKENFNRMILDFNLIANTNGLNYLNKINEYLSNESPDIKQLNLMIDKMCKEVYQCLIE